MTYGKSSVMDEMEALRAENNTLKAGRAESMKVAARLSRTQAELKACKLDLWSKQEQLLDARAAFETRGIQHLDAAMTKIKQLRDDRAAAVKRAEAAEAQVQGLEEDLAFAQGEKSRLAQQLALAEERATEATAALRKWQQNVAAEETFRHTNSETRAERKTFDQNEVDYRETHVESENATSEFVVSNLTQMGWAEDTRQPSQDRADILEQEMAAKRVIALEQEAELKDAELASAQQALTTVLEAAATRDAEWGAVVDGLEELIVSERAKAVAALRAERDRANAAISKALAGKERSKQHLKSSKECDEEPPAPGWVRREVDKSSHREGVNTRTSNETKEVAGQVGMDKSVISATEISKAEMRGTGEIRNEEVVAIAKPEEVPNAEVSSNGPSGVEEIQDEEAREERKDEAETGLEGREESGMERTIAHAIKAEEFSSEPTAVLDTSTTPADGSVGRSNVVNKDEHNRTITGANRGSIDEWDVPAASSMNQTAQSDILQSSNNSGGSGNDHADSGPSMELGSGTESDEMPSTGAEERNLDTIDSALEVSVLIVTAGITTTIQTAETTNQEGSASEGDEADVAGESVAAEEAPLEEEDLRNKDTEAPSEKEIEEVTEEEEEAQDDEIAAKALESEERDIVEAEAGDSVSPLSPLSPGSTSGGMAVDSQPTTATTAQAIDVAAVNPPSISTPSQSHKSTDSTGAGSAPRSPTPSGSNYSDEDSCDTLAMEAELLRLKAASEQARNKLITSP